MFFNEEKIYDTNDAYNKFIRELGNLLQTGTSTITFSEIKKKTYIRYAEVLIQEEKHAASFISFIFSYDIFKS